MERSIVATGLGATCSLGNNIDTFWENLVSGRSGVSHITLFDVSDCPTQIGAEIDSQWLTNSFNLREIERTSRVSLMALLAAEQALLQAQLLGQSLDNVGVIIGCSQGGFAESEFFFKQAITSGRTSPFGILKPMNSAPTTNVTIKHKIGGPSFTIDAACSSANHAIGIATKLIKAGIIKTALVGGTDTPFSPSVFKSWCNLRALSMRNDLPESACKPFSKNRDGTVLGEGAGMLVLEEEETALKRGVEPLAYIKGYGASSDAYHLTFPQANGMSKSISLALKDAELHPENIDCINAHATGTIINDTTETQALKSALGQRAQNIPINAIKPNLGHTLAASAALEAIACILSLKSGIVPAMINYDEFDPECDLNFVTGSSRRIDAQNIMSTSFAFGGSNAVIILGKYN